MTTVRAVAFDVDGTLVDSEPLHLKALQAVCQAHGVDISDHGPTPVVGVAIAHHKKTMFTLDERIAMVQEALADCPNVRVASFQGLVRDFARAQGATVSAWY